MDKNKGTRIIIGYVPLFYGQPSTKEIEHINEDVREELLKIRKHIEDAPNPRCCLWAFGPNGAFPVFGIERADEIVKHIKWYSEDAPNEWFYLAIGKNNPNYYDIALFPKHEKMVERYKYQRLILAEEIVQIDSCEIIFKPIHFHSLNRGMIDQIPLNGKMKVGFLDFKKIDIQKLHFGKENKLPEPEILGEFDIKIDDPTTEGFFAKQGRGNASGRKKVQRK